MSALLRLGIFLIPLFAGFLAGGLVAHWLPTPRSVNDVVVWWALVIVASVVVATLTDRFARRLLPLTVLLSMTMLFPDQAPSRMRVARRAGNISDLRRRIADAQKGGDPNLAVASELILSLAAALSSHDRKTRGHSERTKAYTEMLAEQLRIAEPERDRLRWAALLHDVGKLEVPTDILNKDAGLESAEWDLIRKHPVNGMKLIAPLVPWLGVWAKTVEHHHERWDGTGYPYGLVGTQIALGARIVAVADAYDVMTTGRAYQRAKTPAAARQEIVDMAGTQFDPTVARALMNVSLGKLRWATGPLAFLTEIPFLRGLPQVGRDIAILATSSAMMTTSLVAGVIPTPRPIDPVEVVEVVIASAGLGLPESLPLAESPIAPASPPGASPTTTSAGHAGDPDGTELPTAADGEEPVPAGEPSPGSDGPPTTTPASESTPTSTSTATSTTSSTAPPTPSTTTSTTTSTRPPTSTTTTTRPPIITTTTRPPTTTTTTRPPITTTTTPPVPLLVVANPDTASAPAGGQTIIQVLENDTGDLDRRTLAVVAGPSHGSVETVGGSDNLRYRPNDGHVGSDTFRYRICNGSGACSEATVSVTIR